MPYRRPPLSKELLRGEQEESELPLADEEWLVEHDVRLIGGRAMALDAARARVTLAGGRELSYAALRAAPPARSRRVCPCPAPTIRACACCAAWTTCASCGRA